VETTFSQQGIRKQQTNDKLKKLELSMKLFVIEDSWHLIGAVMSPFVADKPYPTMDDYVGNIDYLVKHIGIDHVAIASGYTYQISMNEAEQKARWKMMIGSGARTRGLLALHNATLKKLNVDGCKLLTRVTAH
jgi:microsomal dipeptidase-like Zn-dependent dipeptidase